MELLVLGINHKTAAIEVREKFYLTPTQQELLLSQLKNDPNVAEAFVISTCNRTELYLHCVSDTFNTDLFFNLISSIKKIDLDKKLISTVYMYKDAEVVSHLFNVACGMDSLVLGEKQILGQVKLSFERSAQMGLFSKHFNILSNLAIRAGKKAQTETHIGSGGSSVSWAAISMAQKIIGDLTKASVLIIGAGKMSKLAVGQIFNKGFKKLYLMNRTPENAEPLAQKFNAETVPFCDIKEVLSQVDLVFCASGAPHYIIDQKTLVKVMPQRAQKPIVFLDISMPRNISPDITALAGVSLYTIDDLEGIVQENMAKRQEAVLQVQIIVQNKIKEYFEKISDLTASSFKYA